MLCCEPTYISSYLFWLQIFCFNITVAFVNGADSRSPYKDRIRDEETEKSQLPPSHKGVFLTIIIINSPIPNDIIYNITNVNIFCYF